MDWLYYHEATGTIVDDEGDIAVFDNTNRALTFFDFGEAMTWLREYGILANLGMISQ